MPVNYLLPYGMQLLTYHPNRSEKLHSLLGRYIYRTLRKENHPLRIRKRDIICIDFIPEEEYQVKLAEQKKLEDARREQMAAAEKVRDEARKKAEEERKRQAEVEALKAGRKKVTLEVPGKKPS